MKKYQYFIIILLSLCVLLLGLNLFVSLKKDRSSIDNCLKQVYELKATSDVGVSYGSAVAIKEDLLVSNFHVVSYKQYGKINLFDLIEIRSISDNEFHKVIIHNYDEELDIVYLKIENYILNVAKIGDSSKLKYGDTTYAIGNASNYGITLTKGIISFPLINISYDSKERNVIQSDITISSGNSGGGLFNEKGKLIGITSFRLKDLNGNIIYDIAYSIPINIIKSNLN